MPEPIKIYQFEYCPYCRKVREVLDEKGIAYEKIEVDCDERKKEVQDLSGQGLVPVIVDGDRVINDSQKIIEYLNENY